MKARDAPGERPREGKQREQGGAREHTHARTHGAAQEDESEDCQSIRASRPGIRQLGVVTFPEQLPHHPRPSFRFSPLRNEHPPLRAVAAAFHPPRGAQRCVRLLRGATARC